MGCAMVDHGDELSRRRGRTGTPPPIETPSLRADTPAGTEVERNASTPEVLDLRAVERDAAAIERDHAAEARMRKRETEIEIEEHTPDQQAAVDRLLAARDRIAAA